jgi:predicted metal-dependent enzyme (double-stranded beta helix superfamily)
MFNLDNFVADCCAAVEADPTHRGIHELAKRTFADPSSVLQPLGQPTDNSIVPIYRSKDLTIINVVWKPGMTIMPHNHEMWAVIGIYCGREDNILWRRIKDDPDGHIEAAGARSLGTGDVSLFGKDIIHSVTNPLSKPTGVLHFYGGDLFEVERSEWEPEHLTEHAYDLSKLRAMFHMR